MEQLLVSAGVSAVVNGLVGVVLYYLVNRREESRDRTDKARDELIGGLRERIRKLEEEKLAEFRQQLETALAEIRAHHKEALGAMETKLARECDALRNQIEEASDKRGSIYRKMEDSLVSQALCRQQHEHLNGVFSRFERSLNMQTAALAEISQKLGLVDLIAQHLNIKLGA